MDREESLGKRLLKYLDLEYKFREDFKRSGTRHVIDVFPPQMTRYGISHDSWHSLLFGYPGRFGLRDMRKWLCDNDSPWFKHKAMSFYFESLEELELQLSARGF